MKHLIATLAVFAVIFSVCAQQKSIDGKKGKANEYDIFSFSFAPGISTAPDFVDAYGIRIGIPVAHGKKSYVAGLEFGIVGAMTSHVCGVQTSLIFTSASNKVEGLQMSLVNSAENVEGLQLGLVNTARGRSFQIGLINIIRNSPLVCFPFINARF